MRNVINAGLSRAPCLAGNARFRTCRPETGKRGPQDRRWSSLRIGAMPRPRRATVCPVCPEIMVSVVVWQLQAAKQHFSELVERARRDGPQVVTKHGKDAVVVVSAEEYRRLRGDSPSLVEFIRSAPDFDALDLERSPDAGRDVQL
jgi:prevent-host-death family protein